MDRQLYPLHSIYKPGYRLRSLRLEPGLDRIARRQFHSGKSCKDAYTHFWMLYLYDLPPGMTVDVIWGKTRLALSGKAALYIPPFALVEWIYPDGWMTWVSYSCFHERPGHFPNHPVSFAYEAPPVIRTLGHFIDFIDKGIHGPAPFYLGQFKGALLPGSTAERALAALHMHYAQDTRIEELAQAANMSHSSFTHVLSDFCGIPPAGYRNILRVYDTLGNISVGTPVNDAARRAGYTDYSNYYRQFMNIIGCSPASFTRS